MGCIILRSALVAWGRRPAPDLAYVVGDGQTYRKVTWTEVMANRREKQARRMNLIRSVDEWRACRVHVAYFDMELMGGWQAFITDWRGRGHDVWIDRDFRTVMAPLMKLFPLCLPLGTEREQWEMWKPAFAAQFQRRHQDSKPVGVSTLWMRRGQLQFQPGEIARPS